MTLNKLLGNEVRINPGYEMLMMNHSQKTEQLGRNSIIKADFNCYFLQI